MKNKKGETRKKDVPETAAGLIGKVLDFFRAQTDKLTEDVAKFNEERKIIQEKVNRGARRTSGRIV